MTHYEPADLTGLPLEELDQLGVLAAGERQNVEIVEAAVDRNPDHGSNTEREMAR